MELKYKKIEKKLEIRKERHQKVIEECPGRMGIIWEKPPNCKIGDIEKTKYLNMKSLIYYIYILYIWSMLIIKQIVKLIG